jgi:hypothetical protein
MGSNKGKLVNDIRSTSFDPRYAGVVFSGPMDDAIAQAKAQPDHNAPSAAREELESFLRIRRTSIRRTTFRQLCDLVLTEQDRDSLVTI